MFIDVLHHSRRSGPPGSPTALETDFGWVLCGGSTSSPDYSTHVRVTSLQSFITSEDDILWRFWEIEEAPPDQSALADVMQEYFDLKHAEEVPLSDMEKPIEKTFYLPMHTVYKATSTTTKVRAVFDASAKSSTGVSLNDTILIGPTVHPPLTDVLLLFRSYFVTLTAVISKMYRAVELICADWDLHRFVWRSDPTTPLKDYCLTRVTFGVSASSFAANMAVKQNALEYAHEYPLSADVVEKCFYVDDCLTGADDSNAALILYQ